MTFFSKSTKTTQKKTKKMPPFSMMASELSRQASTMTTICHMRTLGCAHRATTRSDWLMTFE